MVVLHRGKCSKLSIQPSKTFYRSVESHTHTGTHTGTHTHTHTQWLIYSGYENVGHCLDVVLPDLAIFECTSLFVSPVPMKQEGSQV